MGVPAMHMKNIKASVADNPRYATRRKNVGIPPHAYCMNLDSDFFGSLSKCAFGPCYQLGMVRALY
jgi:hypothetical protein